MKDWKDAATHRKPRWPLAGYAPGNYMGKCVLCEQQFTNMDKRAVHCLPCAIDAVKDNIENARFKLRELEAENEVLRSAIKIVQPA